MNRTRYKLILSSGCMLFLLSVTSCRDKSSGTGPNQPPDGNPWRLHTYTVGGVLRAGARDTISVRLYNDTGVLVNGERVFSLCVNDPFSVTTPVVTSSDTIRFPYGTTSIAPMTYWGEGGPDQTETIFSWVVVNGDTMATTTSRFKIQQ